MTATARRLAAALAAAALAMTVAQAHAGPQVPRHPPLPPGPFAEPATQASLSGRSGDITAAVFNLKSGRTFLYRPGLLADEASIAKVDILATALYEAQHDGGTLSASEQQAATAAIEESDNDAAQDLWDDDGGNPGLGAFNRAAGLTQIVLDPDGAWGYNQTTALDQVHLLAHIALHNSVLSDASRAYELGLMHHIDPAQDWGVSAGVLPPASVALKNGWLPIKTGGWEINSIGWVDGRYRDYLIAVLTAGDPDMAYGVETITGISQIVWDYFRPARDGGGQQPWGAGI
ncbi:MAG TPA: serine hydrolase [Solirubrobacteraceae bacterium]|nr:serine hydrolase [Solirubrobacteraceae bacterium]